MQAKLILACDYHGGIGKDNTIPWYCSDDIEFFKRVTMGSYIIMGRKTFESMGQRELPGRTSLVVGTGYHHSFEQALLQCVDKNRQVFVIGGSSLATYALNRGYISEILLTVVEDNQYRLAGVSKSLVPLEPLESPESKNRLPAYLDDIESKNRFPVQKSGYDCTVFIPESIKPLLNMIIKVFMPWFLKKEVGKEPGKRGKEEKEVNSTWSAVTYTIGKGMSVYQCFPQNPEEAQIRNLVKTISTSGVIQDDRTGVGTRGIFGYHMKFSLENGRFPLQTARKSPFSHIFEELMWFLRGQTNSKILEEKGIKIWVGNSTRHYLDKCGLTHLEEGDCGASYGFQWRHWGAPYINCQTDYTGQGHDQIATIIKEIKERPHSRRMILSGWNVTDLDQMALPPCHTMYQFKVIDGRLSCHLYQRSSDVMLACHWNITSAALLTILIANITGLKPGELYVSYGDAHIYSNHFNSINEYLLRAPLEYPTLKVTRVPERIEDYTLSDLELSGYSYYPNIRLEMNA